DLAALAKRIKSSGAKSVAVCLLHSWADPQIERRVADSLAHLEIPITTSAALVPEFREYERFSTATINAALAPIVGDYLKRLGASIARIGLGDARLSLMQSSGGTTSPERAAAEPARVLLSGPAGGVLGAVRAAAEAGLGDLVSLDMGGTSTDVAFHSPALKTGSGRAGEAPPIGGLPVALPSLDVHTIGCGGGSLAFVDRGGALHVGPKSAGAHPGPVAYGNSDQLTLTDAHIFQGHIVTEHERASHVAGTGFLGGSLALDIDGVTRAFEKLGKRLAVRPYAAAAAMIEIGRAAMGRATGAMTMQRGRDPRGLSLVAFGGAGGLVAADLAASMDIPRVLIPADPGVLSARGLAQAGFRGDASRSLLQPLDNLPLAARLRIFRQLRDELFTLASDQGIAPKDTGIEFTLDLRYRGQSFELGVSAGSLAVGKRGPVGLSSGQIAEAFFAQHERLYGHRLDGHAIEVVNLRAVATEQQALILPPKPRNRALGRDAATGTGKLRIGRSLVQAPILSRAAMKPGMGFVGPAIVLEYSGTTVIPPGWSVRVTGGGHLLLSPESGI
ncbi:MAG: N-methylhydantoinase A, partial [Planctomycetota bacterium]